MVEIWDIEQEQRNVTALQHDADRIDREACWLCRHIGLIYQRDVIAGETHAFKACPRCGAKREI